MMCNKWNKINKLNNHQISEVFLRSNISSPTNSILQSLYEQLLTALLQSSHQACLILAGSNSQQFALMEPGAKSTFIEIELGMVCTAIWVDFDKDSARGRQANGPELHGQRADWRDHNVFHSFGHQRTIQIQAFAIGSHRSRDQQPISLQNSYLNFCLLFVFQVEIENYDGFFHVAMDFQLANCLHHCFAVDIAIQLHYFLGCQSSIGQGFNDIVCHFFRLKLQIIVESRSTSIGYSQNRRSVLATVVSYHFHKGIIVAHHNYQIHQSQVLLISLHEYHSNKFLTERFKRVHLDPLSQCQELFIRFVDDLKGRQLMVGIEQQVLHLMM